MTSQKETKTCNTTYLDAMRAGQLTKAIEILEHMQNVLQSLQVENETEFPLSLLKKQCDTVRKIIKSL